MTMKLLLVCLLAAAAVSGAQGKSTAATAKADATAETAAATDTAAATAVAAEGAAEGAEDGKRQYPFRDLPADVLRDFPGLCFGSTALRLFHIGQSWSLTPFCGVATCLVSKDRRHLIERVQDCGPQPKRNPKCKNVNQDSEAQFPECCPVFVCEEGVELEYPTQEELQKLAHEAAQAAVRAQYDQQVEAAAQEGVRQPGRKAAEAEVDATGDEEIEEVKQGDS